MDGHRCDVSPLQTTAWSVVTPRAFVWPAIRKIVRLVFLEVKANALHTLFQEIENAGGMIGNVNNSTVYERATVINAHNYGLAIA
jgi:tRNA U38,U39,U40 pseudouridine synthase TruA